MVAVADGVPVLDRYDRDRREDGAAMLGQPDPLPAVAGGRRRAEIAVEQRGAGGLGRAADGAQRDLADPAAGGRATDVPRVVDGEGAARPGLAAHRAHDRAEPPRAGDARERPLRVDLGGTGHEHATMLARTAPWHIGRTERL